eukprot:829584-Prorocentrum_lima.AAC.1
MTSSLVGSEMCIRDSYSGGSQVGGLLQRGFPGGDQPRKGGEVKASMAVSYTHLTLPTICSV